MAVTVRRAGERGGGDFGWLKTRHTFSFGEYQDPEHLRYRTLRVINEDVVAPGQGFEPHSHRDMEIVTYLLEGTLAHEDSLGSFTTMSPEEVQLMSAGSGIEHGEFNAASHKPLHLLQIWILPARRGLSPRYEQREFPFAERRNRLRLIVSPDGREGALTIGQDASIYCAQLEAGVEVRHELAPGRGSWVQVARGAVTVNGTSLTTGDGCALEGEPAVVIAAAGGPAEVLLFDLA